MTPEQSTLRKREEIAWLRCYIEDLYDKSPEYYWLSRVLERLSSTENEVTEAQVEQAAIYAWEAAPSSMVGCFRLWNEVPDGEKNDWRKIAIAMLKARNGL